MDTGRSRTTHWPARRRTDETPLKILLIEDNLGDARLVQELLAELPGERLPIQWARSLSSAIGYLTSERFDVLLADLDLPDSRGLDTVRSLLEHAWGGPIVVLTGLVDDRTALLAAQAGAQDYLVKREITPDVLDRVLRYAVERHRHERGEHFLLQASRALAASLDYETTLQQVAKVVVPELAELCLVDVLTDDGKVQRVGVAAAGPLNDLSAASLRGEYEMPREVAGGVPLVLRTGEPETVTSLDDEIEAMFPLVPKTAEQSAVEMLARLQGRWRIIVPVIAEGRTLGCLTLVLPPMSARRSAERELRLAERLAERAGVAVEHARLYRQATAAIQAREEALRARDDVLRFVSHDLKGPLTTMRVQTELLLSLVAEDASDGNVSQDISPQLDRGLRRIEAWTRTMTDMVGELLDATQLEAGESLQLNRTAMDLVVLARRVVAEQQLAHKRHNIRLEASPAALVGSWDGVRLKRVLDNLLSNAAKYSPEASTIRVTVGCEHRDGTDWAVMCVQDDGIGIPAEDLPHVFEMFYRATNVPSYVRGTGIGLAGVQQVVCAHGGSVDVEAIDGGGSLFTVRMPIRDGNSDTV